MHGPLPVTLCLLLAGAPAAITAAGRPGAAELYGRWQNGPSTNANYFPIAVWVQSPKNAARYKAAGINLYVGLWRGPTEEQLGNHPIIRR